MSLPLAVHRQHLRTIEAQRRLLDKSYGETIAAGLRDGFSVAELLSDAPSAGEQPEFDL